MQTEEQFRALYWGQLVLRPTDQYLVFINEVTINYEGFLSLNPLSSITDDHLVAVAKMCNIYEKTTAWKEETKWLIDYINDDRLLTITFNGCIAIRDYLISQGYLLDESALEKGWAKLKEQ